MAALNGHVDSVHLLLELGASVTAVTVEDGTTIDLIGELLISYVSSVTISHDKREVLPQALKPA